MKIITIRGIDFQKPSEIHDFLEQELTLPEYYGRNLDALHDVLTDICEETQIIIDTDDMEDDAMREYLHRLTRAARDASEENSCIQVDLKQCPLREENDLE